jgi:hypothetical protein
MRHDLRPRPQDSRLWRADIGTGAWTVLDEKLLAQAL